MIWKTKRLFLMECLIITDKELEDFKTTIAYEERKKNKDFKLIEFEDFIKEREEKYGVKF